jgi:TDG/mug DNA glycosylase family protein
MNEAGEPKRSFPPVVDDRTRLLVLGSLPGEQSLARQRYYGNPRNQFWRLIGEVVDRDLPSMSYEARLAALLSGGVGLWDVIASAFREGSLDGALRDHRVNPLAELAAGLPQLRAIAFNGGTSARIGVKALSPVGGWELITLPSSSPAYTLSYELKRAAWLRLRRFLL